MGVEEGDNEEEGEASETGRPGTGGLTSAASAGQLLNRNSKLHHGDDASSAAPAAVFDAADEEELQSLSMYLKNTPLLWASFKGHLRVVWLLLVNGYSPNDVDNLGNNALHLSAVNGHLSVLQVLVNDGGSANPVNFYKNKPIDMATNKVIREILAVAMEKGASYTLADIAVRHEQNLKQVRTVLIGIYIFIYTLSILSLLYFWLLLLWSVSMMCW